MSWIDNSETSACLLCSEKIRSGSSREDKNLNYCDDHVIHSVISTKQSVIHNKEQNNGDFSTTNSMETAISTKHDPKKYLDPCRLNTFSWQRRKRRTFSTKFNEDCFNVVIRSVYALSFLVLCCSLINPSNAIQPSPPSSSKRVSSRSLSNNPAYVSKAHPLVLSSGDSEAKAAQTVGADIYFKVPSRYEGRLSKSRKQRDFETKAIKKRNCEVAGKHGECMFVWQCLKTKGKHLGMCMDGFMFGSCCVYPDDEVHSINNDEFENLVIEKEDNSIAATLESIETLENDEDNDDDKWSNIKYRPGIRTTTTESASKKGATSTTSKATVTYIKPTRPTRPSRPAKPGVRWPPSSSDFHLLQQSLSNSNEDTDKKTTSTYHHHSIQLFKPTKSPPIKSNDKVKPNKDITSTTIPKTTETSWIWEKVSAANSDETLELPHKNIPHIYQQTPSKVEYATTNKYYPSTGASSDDNDDFTTNRRPVRPTRPARPPKPNQVITYFPGGGFNKTPSANLISNIRNTTSKFSYLTTPVPSQDSTSTIFPIIIRRTTKTPPTRKTTTTTTITTTSKVSAYSQPIFHTIPTTTKSSTPRPVTKTTVSASSRSGGCGLPQIKQFCPKGRIVNGTQSCYGQFPWQVSVRRTSFFGFSSTHRCGGALINELWVATAGHCVDDLLVAKIRVRIGEWDFSSTSEPLQNIERKITKKIVHPKYNFFTYENDLALLKLDKRIDFQDNIIPICLPANDDLLIGEMGTVAGWGRLSEGGQLPSILQYVSVPIVSNEKCQSMFLRAGRHEVIPDIFMCAGYENGGRDSCQGDSGGPLVVKGKSGRWFLGGIISWGIGCAEPNLPGVCTRISKFREWILDKVT